MVVFVDLEQAPPAAAAPTAPMPEMNQNHPFSAAIVLYPFIAGLARYLDRTDLHNLASTCRHLHRTLTDYRHTLLTLSLRCGWPEVVAAAELAAATTPAEGPARLTNPIKRPCPKDLVQGCIRCSLPICRDCIRKPHPTHLNSRLRRLCPPCQRDAALLPSAALPAYEARTLYCACATSVWICAHCMKHVSAEDYSYQLLCDNWAGESMRDVRTLVRGGNGQFVSGGSKVTGGGRVSCARGPECSGIPSGGWGADGDDGDDGEDEEVGREEVVVLDGETEWSELAEALESTGEQRWEETAQNLKIVRERSGKVGGRPVEWDGKGGALVKEWHGDVRGWCNWCDKVVLSRVDKARTGLSG